MCLNHAAATAFPAFVPGGDRGIYFAIHRDEAEKFALLLASGTAHVKTRNLEVSLT